jgi:hypothetical protein
LACCIPQCKLQQFAVHGDVCHICFKDGGNIFWGEISFGEYDQKTGLQGDVEAKVSIQQEILTTPWYLAASAIPNYNQLFA